MLSVLFDTCEVSCVAELLELGKVEGMRMHTSCPTKLSVHPELVLEDEETRNKILELVDFPLMQKDRSLADPTNGTASKQSSCSVSIPWVIPCSCSTDLPIDSFAPKCALL